MDFVLFSIFPVAASCMEFFADAQRLFVGLGNGTIKVSRRCLFIAIQTCLQALHSLEALQPGLPSLAVILIHKPVVDVARDAQCCVHTRPQLVWKKNCSVYQLSIHSSHARSVRHWLYHRERVL